MPTTDSERIQNPWNQTGIGTTAGVTVTKTGVATKRQCVSHVSGSGDAAAVVTIESPAATILWRKRFAAAFTFSENLPDEVYMAAEGADILAKISASTANSELNLSGYQRE
jgi:hypothetical protein